MTEPQCPQCGEQKDFSHSHQCAHGIPETHMAGSEQFGCQKCGRVIYAAEGMSLGFKFVLDAD